MRNKLWSFRTPSDDVHAIECGEACGAWASAVMATNNKIWRDKFSRIIDAIECMFESISLLQVRSSKDLNGVAKFVIFWSHRIEPVSGLGLDQVEGH